MYEKRLQKIRDKINGMDQKLVDLINKRTQCALEIGRLKLKQGQPIYAPQREKDVYDKISRNNQGPLSNASLKAIYREVMSAAISLEKMLVIGYLGPKASYTQQAAVSKFGASLEYVPFDSIGDIFTAVEKGYVDYGVVPVENSIEGMVTHTLDMFMESDVVIYAEILLAISHNLISKEDDISKIETVYSKDQVFGQCRQWIRANMPQARLVEVASTSRAVTIAKKEKRAAALASKIAAGLYGMKIQRYGIEDSPHNVTRFWVISRHKTKKAKDSKTSIMFAIKHEVGALYEALIPFKQNKINLTKIESRPCKTKAWEYYFFVDFLGNADEAKVKRSLSLLEKQCTFLKVLGSYMRCDVVQD